MGRISDRKMRTGCSSYSLGTKRKGPRRRIICLTSLDFSFFGRNTGWLACGHWSGSLYGKEFAVCEKCRLGKPKDTVGKDGWPTYITGGPPSVAGGRNRKGEKE